MKSSSRAGKAAAALIWIVLWEIAALLIGNRIILISPTEALQRLSELMGTAAFWKSLAASTGRVMLGFLLSLLAAVPLSCLAYRSRTAAFLLAPVVKTMRAIPVASFVILALILFRSLYLSIFIAFTVSFPVLYTSMSDALSGRSASLHEMAEVFCVPLMRRIRYLDLFEVIPNLTTACRMAVGMAWKAGIAAELIGIPRFSVGEHLQQAKTFLDMADLFAWTVAVIAASILCERAVLFLILKIRNSYLRF